MRSFLSISRVFQSSSADGLDGNLPALAVWMSLPPATEYSCTFFSGADSHLEPPGRRTLFISRRQWGVA